MPDETSPGTHAGTLMCAGSEEGHRGESQDRGRGEVGGDVSSGVQDAPDVDAVVGGHVEDEVGEFLERPVPKLWDLQFKCESERPGERMLLKVVDRSL